jgi:hypothetical protein
MSSTSFVKSPDREEIVQEHARVRMEIMRLRSAKTSTKEDDLARLKWDRTKYETSGYMDEVPIDPNRRGAPYWKKLAIDAANPIFVGNELEDYEIVEGSEGFLKVRWLHGRKAGAVENLPILQYFHARNEALSSRYNPKCEPVPDDEKLVEPTRHPQMPSSMRKAREKAAKVLKKQPEERTFDEIVTCFKTVLNKPRDPFGRNAF